MKQKQIEQIIEDKYEEYAQIIQKQIESLNREFMQSGEDSSYKNVWEEYAVQIQGEESIMFEMFEETIIDMCVRLIQKYGENEIKLLWLKTDEFFGYDDNDYPPIDEMENAVSNELYSRIRSLAEEYELEEDHEDELKWYDFEIDELPGLPELTIVRQIQAFVDAYWFKDNIDEMSLPNWVVLEGYPPIVVPTTIEMIEIIHHSQGSDIERLTEETVIAVMENLLRNLSVHTQDLDIFKIQFRNYLEELSWELDDLLECDDPEEKLWTTYQVLANMKENGVI